MKSRYHEKLAFGIRQAGRVIDEHRRHYDTCYDRYVQLSTEDERTPHERCLAFARLRAEQELPPAQFWWPQSTVAETDCQRAAMVESNLAQAQAPPQSCPRPTTEQQRR